VVLGELEAFASVPEWLEAIADTELVAEGLRTSPGFADGPLTLNGVQIGRVRLKKRRWTGLYKLSLIDAAGTPGDVALHGTLMPSDEVNGQGVLDVLTWNGLVPPLRLAFRPLPPDPVLSEDQPLTDPALAGPLLEQLLREGSAVYRDLRVAGCESDLVRYKPGSRATILFHLQYPEQDAERGWPDRVIAKRYRDLRGAGTYAAMRELWNTPLRSDPQLTLAEPLAFDPDRRILLQRYIPHATTVRRLVREARREGTPELASRLDDHVHMAGAGLAAMHSVQAEIGPPLVFDHELGDLLEDLADLTAAVPRLKGADARFLTSVTEIAARVPADPSVPSHGAFRPDQVLLTQDGIGFIDFDGACQAEPAMDVAEFLGALRSVSLTVAKGDDDTVDEAQLPALLARADELAEMFLTEYERHRPISRDRVAIWEAIGLLTRLADGWAKVKPARLRMHLALMQRFLAAHPEFAA
jgi:hypothetical protein